MAKIWKRFHGADCPDCGNMLVVWTKCAEKKDDEFEQFFHNGDKVKCYLHCGFKTKITVESGEAGLKYYDDL